MDYTLGASTLPFASDQVEACFEVQISDDSVLEGNEIIQISLTTTGQTPLNTSVTIIDDDSAEISFNPVMYQVNEASGSVTLRVSIVGEVAIALEYSVEFLPMTASRSDFNSSGITRVLPLLRSSDSFDVEVFDDSVPEGKEMFEARLIVPPASAEKGVCVCMCVQSLYCRLMLRLLSQIISTTGLRESLTANRAMVIIADDDVVTVTFASDTITVQEGAGVAMVTVQTDRAAAADLALRVTANSSSSATGEQRGRREPHQ